MSRGKRQGPNRAVSPELIFNFGQDTRSRDCQRHWGSLRNPNPPSVFHFPACWPEIFTLFFSYSLFNWFWPQTFHSKDCMLPPSAELQQGDHSIVWNLKAPTSITAYDLKSFWDAQCDAWDVYVPETLRVLYRFIAIWGQTKNPLSFLADLDEPAV